MTWPLVILRVNRSTYEDIQRRVIAAGQSDRIFTEGGRKYVSVDEVAIEVDPDGPEESAADIREPPKGARRKRKQQEQEDG